MWTLLTVMDCGLPVDHPPIRDAARQFLDHHLTPERIADKRWLLTRLDLCHVGFWLRIRAYFLPGDPRIAHLAGIALQEQMANGRWIVEKRIPSDTLFDMKKRGGKAGGIRFGRSAC